MLVPAGDIYEYKIFEHLYTKDFYDSEKCFNELGRQGWKLIAVTPRGEGDCRKYYFCRRMIASQITECRPG